MRFALIAVILFAASCAHKNLEQTKPVCKLQVSGNSCEAEVERKYCAELATFAPEVQEIVLHDVECSQNDGDEDRLRELGCYQDDSKVVALMKDYWNKPEGQALVYFPDKLERAKAKCAEAN